MDHRLSGLQGGDELNLNRAEQKIRRPIAIFENRDDVCVCIVTSGDFIFQAICKVQHKNEFLLRWTGLIRGATNRVGPLETCLQKICLPDC